jgi:hypothetical protein
VTARHLIAYAIIVAALALVVAWRLSVIQRRRNARGRTGRIDLFGED